MRSGGPSFFQRLAAPLARGRAAAEGMDILAPTAARGGRFAAALSGAAGDAGARRGMFLAGFEAAAEGPVHDVFLSGAVRGGLRRVVLRVASWAGAPVDASARDGALTSTMICVIPFALASGSDLADARDAQRHLTRAAAFARAEGRLRKVAIAIVDLPREAGPFHRSQVVCTPEGRCEWSEAIGRLLETAARRPGDGLADPRWRRALVATAGPDGLVSRLFGKLREGLKCDVPVFFFKEGDDAGDAEDALLAWLVTPSSLAENRTLRGRLWVAAVAAGLACAAALAVAFHAAPIGLPPAVWGADDASLGRAAEAHADRYTALTDLLLGGDTARSRLATAAAILLRSAPAPATPEIKADDGGDRTRAIEAARARSLERLRALEAARAALVAASGRADDKSKAARDLAAVVEEGVAWRESWLAEPDVRKLPREIAKPLDDAIERGAREAGIGSISFEDGIGRPLSTGDVTSRMAGAAQSIGRSATAELLRRLQASRTPLQFYDVAIPESKRSSDREASQAVCDLLPRLDEARLATRLQAPGGATAPDRALLSLAAQVTAIRKRSCRGAPLLGSGPSDQAEHVVAADKIWKEPKYVTWSCGRVAASPWHLDVRPPGAAEYVPCQWLADSGPGSGECLVAFETRPGDRIQLGVNRVSAVHVRAAAPASACSGGAVVTHTIDGPRFDVMIDGDRVTCYALAGWDGADGANGSEASGNLPAMPGEEGAQPFAEITASLISDPKAGDDLVYRIDTLASLASGGEPAVVTQLDAACPAIDLQPSLAHVEVGGTLTFHWTENQQRGAGKVFKKGKPGNYTLMAPAGGWPVSCVRLSGLERHTARMSGWLRDGSQFGPARTTVQAGVRRPWRGKAPPPPETIEVRLYWPGADGTLAPPVDRASAAKPVKVSGKAAHSRRELPKVRVP